jgi:hypothetical protein
MRWGKVEGCVVRLLMLRVSREEEDDDDDDDEEEEGG